MSEITGAFSSIVSDALSIIAPGLPTATLCTAIQMSTHHLLHKRTDEAFEILLEETRDGVFPSRTPDDISSVLGMMLRYQRAAIEGSAKVNLRIMASIFKGILEQECVYPDKFQSMANRISDLTVEELWVVALVYKYKRAIDEKRERTERDLSFSECDEIGDQIFGKDYKNQDRVLAYCASASRAGLIMPQYDQNLFRYTTTHIMDELVVLSDFQKILDKEN
ncbi:MAG: hypothetical protein WC989_08105 [Micavibrio sp.]